MGLPSDASVGSSVTDAPSPRCVMSAQRLCDRARPPSCRNAFGLIGRRGDQPWGSQPAPLERPSKHVVPISRCVTLDTPVMA